MKNSVLARVVATPKRLATLGLLAAGVLAVALLAQAGQMVPFKAKCFGHWTQLSPLFVATATGEATHIGQFTATIKEYESWRAKLVITAANGDKLFGDVDMGSPTSTVNITGGTGRFDGASGSWESTWTSVDWEACTWTETAIGEISTVGSNKK